MTEVLLGDCVEVMAGFLPDSIDAICTDPPYGLEFMGKEWDRLGAGTELVSEGMDASHPFRDGTRRVRYGQDARSMQAWHQAWAAEAYRVAKPGAHLLAFGGTRTYHRLASAIEDAGWEIRDCLVWAYASGFPKSLDVSKAIDKAAGAEREVTRPATRPLESGEVITFDQRSSAERERRDEPMTDAAKRWQGWGTALKPAWEPIVLARKPLRGTVAANVTRYGTGALNIDGTRIPTEENLNGGGYGGELRDPDPTSFGMKRGIGEFVQPAGRWPPNLLLTDAEVFDVRNDGVVGSGAVTSVPGPYANGSDQSATGGWGAIGNQPAGYVSPHHGDTGGYARFFLVPKSSRSDREPDLPDYAIELHRASGECDKLDGWDASTLPARATSEDGLTDDKPSGTSSPGSPSTDRSPRAIRSTTSTATSRTTASRTSSSSTPRPTSDSTPAASSETGSGGSPATSAESSSLWAEPTGISAPKDGRSTDDADPATSRSWSSRNRCARCGKPLPRFSTHPTQKPTALMRHLVRLVTPPGGVVLDCFAGSGSTLVAATLEGFAWIGIEKEPEYVAIAEARLNGTQQGLAL